KVVTCDGGVREYPTDERTVAARIGLVGPAGVPGGVAGMSNGLGLCRSRVPYTGMARSSAATLVAGRGKSHMISVIVYIFASVTKTTCPFIEMIAKLRKSRGL
nr:hypothetical protein [Tanacetum cinerariifolium]